MAFDYYQRLKPWQQRVYDQSDAITEIRLTNARDCETAIIALRDALASENRKQTQTSTRAVVNHICAGLGCRSPLLKVLSSRPGDDYEELHGLYEYGDDETPLITVWMRTAQHKRVVAVRSYLRTVLHELCHHLDYEHFELRDSFHTEGFYKRESSLFKQLTENVDLPRANRKINDKAGNRRNEKQSRANQATASPATGTKSSNADPVYIEDNRDWS